MVEIFNIKKIRSMWAIRAARKLVGTRAYESAKATRGGQIILDRLAVELMKYRAGQGNKNDIGCFVEEVDWVINSTGRLEKDPGR